MSNVRVDVNDTIKNGSEIVFISPCDCTEISKLNVHHLDEEGNNTVTSFIFKDSHGNELFDVDLFAKGVYVKVLLNVTEGIAYIQNADTNKYLEERLSDATIASITGGKNPTIQDSTNAPLIYGKFKGYTLQNGEPTPDNPVEINGLAKDGAIEVKTCGKNLCDNNNFTLTAGTSTAQSNYAYQKINITGKLKSNTTYVLSADVKILAGSPTGISIGLFNKGLTSGSEIKTGAITNNHVEVAIGTGSDASAFYYLLVYAGTQGSTVGNSIEFSNVMLRESTTDATYEPYTETTTAITTGAPLYEGDYIEIYADGSGKLVREWNTLNVTEWRGFSNALTNSKEGRIYAPSDMNMENQFYCTIATWIPQAWDDDRIGICSIGGTDIKDISVRVPIDATITDYPCEILYKLITPTETPLTAEQVAQFKQIYTFEPVTNVFCDGEVEVLYYKNTDNGETVGIVHKKVEKNERAVNSVNNYYSSFKQTFDTVVGGIVSENMSNVEYTEPSFLSGSMYYDVYKGNTLVNGLKSATAKIAETLSSMCDFFAKKTLYDDTTINIGRKAGTTIGNYSTAEGADNTASVSYSHAEGYKNVASGNSSHAEGRNTTASGMYSHAECYSTKAEGNYSHAEGNGTIAHGNSQHVQGKFNVEDTKGKYAHVVGGGTSDTERKNIHTLDWEGNAVYSGDVVAHDEGGNEISLRKINEATYYGIVPVTITSSTEGMFGQTASIDFFFNLQDIQTALREKGITASEDITGVFVMGIEANIGSLTQPIFMQPIDLDLGAIWYWVKGAPNMKGASELQQDVKLCTGKSDAGRGMYNLVLTIGVVGNMKLFFDL